MEELLPFKFKEKMIEIWGEEKWKSLSPHFSKIHPTIFRVNTLKTPLSVLSELEKHFNFDQVPDVNNCFKLEGTQRKDFVQSAFHTEGQVYIQNVSSMIPALTLKPSEDDWVLDLTAAPGSKTSLLANIMNNKGRISAVEVVKDRFFRLKANLKNLGVENVTCYQKNGDHVYRNCPEQFDKVLIDAPCSTESKFTLSDPKSFEYWSPKKVKEMASKQRRLLFSAINSTKVGGEILYSTCSFSPEENEMIIDWALKKFEGKIHLLEVNLPASAPVGPGMLKWRRRNFREEMLKTVRVEPNDYYEGFYLCHIKKTHSTIEREY